MKMGEQIPKSLALEEHKERWWQKSSTIVVQKKLSFLLWHLSVITNENVHSYRSIESVSFQNSFTRHGGIGLC